MILKFFLAVCFHVFHHISHHISISVRYIYLNNLLKEVVSPLDTRLMSKTLTGNIFVNSAVY
jgi:fatty acid desaturase